MHRRILVLAPLALVLPAAAEGITRRTMADVRAHGHGAGRARPARSPTRTPGRTLATPPYSADLNPIEQAFARLKALVRAAAPRELNTLWNSIGQSLARFTPHGCANSLAKPEYPGLT
jgi:transposase